MQKPLINLPNNNRPVWVQKAMQAQESALSAAPQQSQPDSGIASSTTTAPIASLSALMKAVRLSANAEYRVRLPIGALFTSMLNQCTLTGRNSKSVMELVEAVNAFVSFLNAPNEPLEKQLAALHSRPARR